MTARKKRWVVAALGLGLTLLVVANAIAFPRYFGAQVHFKWGARAGLSEVYVFPPGEEVGLVRRFLGAIVAIESRPFINSFMRKSGWEMGEGWFPVHTIAFPPIVTGFCSACEWTLVDPKVTPLMRAADEGDLQAVKQLLASGADVNAHDQRGWTPLMHASMSPKRTAPVLQALLDAGAEVNAKDMAGRTALIWAAVGPGWDGDGKLRVLLAAGADPNAKSSFGETPLESVVGIPGALSLASQLLAAGADPNTRVLNGVTVLSIAEEDGRSEMANLLRQAGARE